MNVSVVPAAIMILCVAAAPSELGNRVRFPVAAGCGHLITWGSLAQTIAIRSHRIIRDRRAIGFALGFCRTPRLTRMTSG